MKEALIGFGPGGHKRIKCIREHGDAPPKSLLTEEDRRQMARVKREHERMFGR